MKRGLLFLAALLGLGAVFVTAKPKRKRKAKPKKSVPKLRTVTVRPPKRFWRSLLCKHPETVRYILGGRVCAACGDITRDEYVTPGARAWKSDEIRSAGRA